MTRVLEVVRRLWWKRFAALAALALGVASPVWGPPLLAHLSYFRVRRVEVRGVRYLRPAEVLERLDIDTTLSIWDDTDPLERRVARHPEVRTVRIGRKLPGTLVVHVTEKLPVAFVPSPEGLHVVDSAGQVLPIDPIRTDVDLPLVAKPDTALLRLLAAVHARMPALFDRISDVRRVGREELVLTLPRFVIRAPETLTATRLADIIPVEHDLARRHARVAELDLRFRDQVIARLQ